MKFDAAVFDLDGTLLDSLDDISDCMNAALTAQGFPTHPKEKYKYFVGDGMDILAQRVLPEGTATEERIHQCVQLMRKEYHVRWKDKSRPYPGVPELLNAMQERGIKLTVLSNKPDDFSKLVVKEIFGAWPWAIVFGARANVAKKPDPAGAIEITKILNLDPARCVYFGDTNTDMFTARGAGMYALGCTWGFRPAKELTDAGAHALIDAPLDALKYL